jgi:thiol-disulfide isomerase/thioredoxin
MKTTTFSILLLICLCSLAIAQPKTIINPAYEFKNTGIYNVAKIELTDTITLITMNMTFVPYWWVNFDSTDVIRDCATGVEYKIKKIRGGVFNEHIWMGASGDSTFILEYPPLPASTKKIDYQDVLFGLSLDPAKAGQQKPATVLPTIDKWMKEQLAKAPKTALPNYDLSSFFNEKPARLIGCIKGYDPRAGFTTGIVYAQNELTRDDYPIVIKIEPDGRFEAELPMVMPKHTWAIFNERVQIPFYIEPGQTLCMVLEWDEFLTFDRRRNIRYQFSQIEFRGALASINQELMTYPSNQFNYEEYDKKRKTMAPLDFKADQLAAYQKDLDQFESYLKEHTLSAKAKTLLQNKIMLDNANMLFNYTMSRDYYSQQDSTNEILKMPIPESYYDFLKPLPLNDPSLLVCNEFSEFINRFEYNELFSKAQSLYYKNMNINRKKPEKNLLQYIDEEKIAITDDERKFLTIATKEQLTEEDKAQLEQLKEVSKAFNEKNKEQIQKYSDKYFAPLYAKNNSNSNIDIWRAKDSILVSTLGLQPNLAYEIAKTRSLDFAFKYAGSKENASELWDSLKQGIKTPFLVATGDRLLSDAFPENPTASKTLPNGPATDVFRKIVAPYKGKVVFVDFWATTCGPCVAGIKRMKETRAKYANNPDFDFVFITDQRSSPEQNYTNFVKEQEMKNTYRLSTDEFNLLRQLFKFNGIPRYVVIDQKGDVINDDFAMHNFQMELGKILPAYK